MAASEVHDESLSHPNFVKEVLRASAFAQRAFTEEEILHSMRELGTMSIVREEPELSDDPLAGSLAHSLISSLLKAKLLRFRAQGIASVDDVHDLEYEAAMLRVSLEFGLSLLHAKVPEGLRMDERDDEASLYATDVRTALVLVGESAEETVQVILGSLHAEVMRLRFEGTHDPLGWRDADWDDTKAHVAMDHTGASALGGAAIAEE